jgi:hypothetical protein
VTRRAGPGTPPAGSICAIIASLAGRIEDTPHTRNNPGRIARPGPVHMMTTLDRRSLIARIVDSVADPVDGVE